MSDKDEANGKLHERDLYAWSTATELLLFDRRIHEIDWDAVGDELERSAELNDADPIRETVEKLLTHLTIWNGSPDHRNPDRRSEIDSASYRLEDALSRSPSLAGLIDLEWKSLRTRARFAAMLILGGARPLGDRPTLELVTTAADESEAETKSDALTRLRQSVATNYDDEADGSDDDHYAWCRAQAAAARSRQFDELDPLGIAEEILGVGTSVRRTVIESLAGLLDRLMAWQAGRRSLSLKNKIASDRACVRALLWKNPSVAVSEKLVAEAHKFTLRAGEWVVVAREPISPQSCPWTLAQIIDDASITERDTTFTNATGAS